MQTLDAETERLLRELAPQVLGALTRRYGHFDAAEDAVQEALLAAARQWPEEGEPDNPRAWLIRVASRRMTDFLRSERARREREEAQAVALPRDELRVSAADATGTDADDTLILLFLCCHPSLTPSSQVALTLRAVGGLSTEEIARAFLVPESTMGQRISRGKQGIRKAGARFRMPPAEELETRLAAVLHVLYLIFNEGYTATSGSDLHRIELSTEAIRLARTLCRLMPDNGEVAGLLALMLLTDARRTARVGPAGDLIPLAEQDRTLWDTEAIAEGVRLVSEAIADGEAGPYQLQAAIAALHDEAPSHAETDWRQIVALYGVLETVQDNPMVTLNRAVATAMAAGAQAGLDVLKPLDDDPRVNQHHRLAAVRAHLLEQAGETPLAAEEYILAAKRTTSLPERRYLERQAARLTS